MLVSDGRVACSACRLRFPDDLALQRHARLDHAPAPDGLDLLEQALRSLEQPSGPPPPARPDPPPGLDPGLRPGPHADAGLDWPVLAGTALVLGWALALLLMLLLGSPG